MKEKQRARSMKLLKLGRMGMKELVKQPVKQAVREALAEERALADDGDRDRTEIKEVPRRQTKPTDYDTVEYDTEQDDSGGGMLKSALLLAVLGLVAVVLVKKRKMLMGAVKSKDSQDESGTSTVANQRSTTHSDTIGSEESTSHMSDKEPAERSTGNADEYDVDTGNEGLSTTE